MNLDEDKKVSFLNVLIDLNFLENITKKLKKRGVAVDKMFQICFNV